MCWVPPLSVEQAGSTTCLPHRHTETANNFRTRKPDGDCASAYSKCDGWERLKVLFCYCSPSKGQQTSMLCHPHLKVPLQSCFIDTGRYFASRELNRSRLLGAERKCSLSQQSWQNRSRSARVFCVTAFHVALELSADGISRKHSPRSSVPPPRP